MLFQITRGAPDIPMSHARKTPVRLTMETLEVGDAFVVDNFKDAQRAIDARKAMSPMRFSVRKLPRNAGWQVRREE